MGVEPSRCCLHVAVHPRNHLHIFVSYHPIYLDSLLVRSHCDIKAGGVLLVISCRNLQGADLKAINCSGGSESRVVDIRAELSRPVKDFHLSSDTNSRGIGFSSDPDPAGEGFNLGQTASKADDFAHIHVLHSNLEHLALGLADEHTTLGHGAVDVDLGCQSEVELRATEITEKFRQLNPVNFAVKQPFALLGLRLAFVVHADFDIMARKFHFARHREFALAVAEVLVNISFFFIELHCVGSGNIGDFCVCPGLFLLISVFFIFIAFPLPRVLFRRPSTNLDIQRRLRHCNILPLDLEVLNITGLLGLLFGIIALIHVFPFIGSGDVLLHPFILDFTFLHGDNFTALFIVLLITLVLFHFVVTTFVIRLALHLLNLNRRDLDANRLERQKIPDVQIPIQIRPDNQFHARQHVSDGLQVPTRNLDITLEPQTPGIKEVILLLRIDSVEPTPSSSKGILPNLTFSRVAPSPCRDFLKVHRVSCHTANELERTRLGMLEEESWLAGVQGRHKQGAAGGGSVLNQGATDNEGVCASLLDGSRAGGWVIWANFDTGAGGQVVKFAYEGVERVEVFERALALEVRELLLDG
ncbi:hypothetical protein IFM61392_08491 [Aspergillus lentulus]|nr:hypothetical protein IFM61392_08491 [Aspergillus lentulus]